VNRRSAILLAAAVVAIVGGALLLFGPSSKAGPSALSPAADGWLAARSYLEARGSEVSIVDRPLDAAALPGLLVLGFPCERALSNDELVRLGRLLNAGGTLVFAYSGRRPGPAELLAAEAVGLSLDSRDADPPLSPLRWWAWARSETRLSPDPSLGSEAGEVVVRALEVRASGPSSSRTIYRNDRDAAAIFSYPRGRGTVVALPADALSNSRIGSEGNANLLESLRDSFGSAIAFDEYAHGLAAPDAAAASGSAPSLDLLVVQLLLLYGLCVWALARAFGPAWREPPALASSTTGFLRGLGAFHRDLGHSAEAAWRLIQNAEAWDPRVRIGAEMRKAAVDAGDAEFLRMAQWIARRPQGRDERT
jgi:hypothetical protein